jgi:hypothetical protein
MSFAWLPAFVFSISSWIHGFQIFDFVLKCPRWQMIAGKWQRLLEESPNTIRRHAA